MHGPYGTSDQNKTDQTNAASRASDFRTQENALLQTYIQSASSLKYMAADAGKRVDTAMTQVHQSLQNQSDLCDAIVNSLRGLIAAIFNR
jgi:hypothetical protein